MPWISFDFDGTLAAWPFQRVVIADLLRLTPDDRLRQAYIRAAARRLRSDHPESAFDVDDIIASLHSEFGLPNEQPTALELCERAMYPQELLYPDVTRMLLWLRERGWRVAISTNGHGRYQRVAIHALGITPDVILSTDVTRAVKPQAQFLQALPRASGDQDALNGLIHVGDRLIEDVLAAHHAGVIGVWLWRDMPDELRHLDLAERITMAVEFGVQAQALEREVNRPGRVGFDHPGEPIIPHFMITSLSELPDVISALRHGVRVVHEAR